MHLRIEVSKTYRTRGGWLAQVIWRKGGGGWYYVIHKPGTEEETGPIQHDDWGQAVAVFSVSEPPVYDQHPADLVKEVKKVPG